MLDRIRTFGARRTVIIVLVVALAGIVLAPTILAASAPPVTGSAPLADLAARGAGLGRILRGEATVLKRDGSTAVIRFDRGEVVSLDTTSIVVKGADGVSATFTVGPDTVVRGGGQRRQLTDVRVGMRVAVFAPAAGTGPSTAAVIRILPAARGGGAKTGQQPTPTPTS